MEGPISFWGYKEQESNLILPEHDDDDDTDDTEDKIRFVYGSSADRTQEYHMRLDVVCLLKLTRKETFQSEEMRYA